MRLPILAVCHLGLRWTVISNLVARACGAVLITAVVLKLQGWSSGTSGVNYFSPAVQLAALEAEALVGLWLLAGWARHGAWLVAVGLFAALAAVSLYLGLIGQSSCGCFGRIRVSPWESLVLDGVCLTGLLAWRQRVDATGGRRPAVIGIGAAVVLGLIGLTLLTRNGVGETWLSRARGEWVAVSPAESDLGEEPAGKVVTFRIEVVNRSGRDVRLIGGTASCSCVATDDLPVTVPANGSVSVSGRILFSGTPGQFKHEYEFFTDLPAQPRVGGRIVGRVGS